MKQCPQVFILIHGTQSDYIADPYYQKEYRAIQVKIKVELRDNIDYEVKGDCRVFQHSQIRKVIKMEL